MGLRARKRYTIISKDSDFNQLSFLYGAPPKIIWLRVGNCTTSAIEHLLRSRLAEIAAFEADDDDSVLISAIICGATP